MTVSCWTPYAAWCLRHELFSFGSKPPLTINVTFHTVALNVLQVSRNNVVQPPIKYALVTSPAVNRPEREVDHSSPFSHLFPAWRLIKYRENCYLIVGINAHYITERWGPILFVGIRIFPIIFTQHWNYYTWDESPKQSRGKNTYVYIQRFSEMTFVSNNNSMNLQVNCPTRMTEKSKLVNTRSHKYPARLKIP